MKHYPHHIGDFDKATRHLTRIERSVYRDLLDMYYDTEAPLPNDLNMVCRKIIARSNEESTAVEQVLNEFFILTNDGWFNSRCDAEIEAYKANNSQKAMAGKASAAAKALRKQQMLNARSTDVEQPFNECSTDVQQTNNGTSTNHKPINQSTINQSTINQEAQEYSAETATPKPSEPKKVKIDSDLLVSTCTGLSLDVAKDYIDYRKQKRAPLNQTSWKKIASEIVKSGIAPDDALSTAMSAGWQGLEADWLINRNAKTANVIPMGGKPKLPSQMTEDERKAQHKKTTEEAKRLVFGDDDFIDGVARHV